MNSTPSAPGGRRALAIVLATLLLDTMGFGIVAPVMPDLIVELTGLSLGEAARASGWLMGTFAAMQALFGPVMGGLSDRFGRRPVLLFCLAAFGLDYLVMGLAPTFGWLFASRAVAGVAGASFVPASAYIADITPPERRARNYGLIGAMFGLGFTLGPAIGGLLGSHGTRAPFFFAGGLALVNAALGGFLLPESLPADRRRPFRLARANPLGTFAALARYRGALPLFAAWFLWMLAHQSYPSTWAFYTQLRFGWSEHAIGLSLSLAGFSMAVSQALLTPRLVPALGERRAILLGLSVGLAGFLATALVPQGWMLYPVMALFALQSLVFPSMNSALSRAVAATEQGELQGAVASLQSVAAILAPPLLTGAFAHFSREGAAPRVPGAPYLLAAACAAGAIAIVATVAGRLFARAAAARAGAAPAGGAAPPAASGDRTTAPS